MTEPFIVVGVDGSQDCAAALHWAVAEAAMRGCAVEAVSVSVLDRISGVSSDLTPFEGRVAAQLAAVGAEYPSVHMRHTQAVGSPAGTLVRHSRGASMLVVGSHGAGAVAQALLGSTSAYCARHAECPVVIVPKSKPLARTAPSTEDSVVTFGPLL
jgi:nucleotide-binding universal stress UspA family protein